MGKVLDWLKQIIKNLFSIKGNVWVRRKSTSVTDDDILEDLPQHDTRWWCKVEDGYILNLLGEKKNKEPYKYNS